MRVRTIGIGMVVVAGLLACTYAGLAAYERQDAADASALAACGAYPNGATERVTPTSRLTIMLPKDRYPNQGGMLAFRTASGTASAGWISNAGPAAGAYGASTSCWAYYYEFDGNGTVDLIATSSLPNVPPYVVHFSVAPLVASGTIEYRNDAYGFSFALPDDWRGYSIVTDDWNGGMHAGDAGEAEATSGPELLIRNPRYTAADPYQDIPIMIFTHAQWDAVAAGSLVVSAAPIGPSKLGENARYVFALPPRYDFAYPDGYQEVEAIMQGKPLEAF
ncbi:MAG TPA: hypothetical protein VFL98_03710 [Candidatus Paceibacterota bacterium]|nr:hypothetical protein [Candidatus Paceibacterota bacterium]